MPLKAEVPMQPPKSPKLFRTQRELSKAQAEEATISGTIPSWVKGKSYNLHVYTQHLKVTLILRN